MLYVFRPQGSKSARELAEAVTLSGLVCRRTKGLKLRTLEIGDKVVCWGANFAAGPNTKTLNNLPVLSKFAEAEKLKAEGVATVQVSRTRPAAAAAAVRPVRVPGVYVVGAARLDSIGATGLIGNLQEFVRVEEQRRREWAATPVVPAETWLPRKNNHVGGVDLLADGLANPDYFSRKENIVEEYRLHMFLGKSIRAGVKKAKATRPDGRTPVHPWIRSYDGGWFIDYAGFESTKAMRDLAAAAVKALGLDFGAVDMAKRVDGSLIVLEVNRAPGVENNTTSVYATKIKAWAAGE